MFVWLFSFFSKFSGVYLVTAKPSLGFSFSLILTSWLLYLCVAFIKFSAGLYRTWLVEHGAYETLSAGLLRLKSAVCAVSAVLWYTFMTTLGYRFMVFVFAVKTAVIPSIERLYRNARWLEKETGEMHDLFYGFKRDRRALFLMPLLYWAPLRKVFPVSGFYELRLNPRDNTIYPTHVSWLD